MRTDILYLVLMFPWNTPLYSGVSIVMNDVLRRIDMLETDAE